MSCVGYWPPAPPGSSRARFRCGLAIHCVAFLVAGGASTTNAGAMETTPGPAQVSASLASLAVPFEANAGDDDPRVAFRARTFTGTLYVTRDGRLVHSLRARNGPPAHDAVTGFATPPTLRRDWVLTETMVGARIVPVGGRISPTHVSRFAGGDPARWRSDVPTYERVLLGEAWPGIAIELAARGRSVEKMFIVAPGADARRIRVQLRGARRLALDGEGALIVETGQDPVRFTAPMAWQDVDGERRPVPVSYKLAGNRYGFVLGAFDPALPVIIDPLLEATYLGGIAGDVAYAMAVDATGAVYVAGSTGSTNFPGTAAGAQAVAAGGGDAFVAKLSHDLTALLQATYLGGSGADLAQALALDANGAVFIAGSTNSTNFPGTGGGAQPAAGGGGDAFLAKLSPDLTKLTQATYLGGSGFDQAFALAVSAKGDVFVAGGTASANFPATAGGAQPVRGGAGDGFVAKLSNDLATLRQATYVGGSGTDVAYALTLAANGVVYVAGSTTSANFPGTAGAAQANAGGGGDAFVAQFDERLTTLMQSTYLGGAGADIAYAVALDPGDAVVVAGDTASANFPGTAAGAQPVKGGSDDAFVAKLDSSLTILTRATYLGGLADDLANGLAVDGAGTIFVVGNTRSTNFPGTAGGAQAGPGGNGDAFAARLGNTLSTLTQATYFGGSGLDQGLAVTVDARGNVYVAGGTASTNLPGTAGAAQPTARRRRRCFRRSAHGEPAPRRPARHRVLARRMESLFRDGQPRRNRETGCRRLRWMVAYRIVVQGIAARRERCGQCLPLLQRQLRAEEFALLHAVRQRMRARQGESRLGVRSRSLCGLPARQRRQLCKLHGAALSSLQRRAGRRTQSPLRDEPRRPCRHARARLDPGRRGSAWRDRLRARVAQARLP